MITVYNRGAYYFHFKKLRNYNSTLMIFILSFYVSDVMNMEVNSIKKMPEI